MRNSEHNGLFHREFVRNKVLVIVILKAESLEQLFNKNFEGTYFRVTFISRYIIYHFLSNYFQIISDTTQII